MNSLTQTHTVSHAELRMCLIVDVDTSSNSITLVLAFSRTLMGLYRCTNDKVGVKYTPKQQKKTN